MTYANGFMGTPSAPPLSAAPALAAVQPPTTRSIAVVTVPRNRKGPNSERCPRSPSVAVIWPTCGACRFVSVRGKAYGCDGRQGPGRRLTDLLVLFRDGGSAGPWRVAEVSPRGEANVLTDSQNEPEGDRS
jgi:hypothetical protein